MSPPCHAWLNPSALTLLNAISHSPATHSRALGQVPHLPPLWLEAMLGVERKEGGAGPRRKIKRVPKTSIIKMNTISVQYLKKNIIDKLQLMGWLLCFVNKISLLLHAKTGHTHWAHCLVLLLERDFPYLFSLEDRARVCKYRPRGWDPGQAQRVTPGVGLLSNSSSEPERH